MLRALDGVGGGSLVATWPNLESKILQEGPSHLTKSPSMLPISLEDSVGSLLCCSAGEARHICSGSDCSGVNLASCGGQDLRGDRREMALK